MYQFQVLPRCFGLHGVQVCMLEFCWFLTKLLTDQQEVPWVKLRGQQKSLSDIHFDLTSFPASVYRLATSTWRKASVTAKSLCNCDVVYFSVSTVVTTVCRSASI